MSEYDYLQSKVERLEKELIDLALIVHTYISEQDRIHEKIAVELLKILDKESHSDSLVCAIRPSELRSDKLNTTKENK